MSIVGYYGAWVLLATAGADFPRYLGTYVLRSDCEAAWVEMAERFGAQIKTAKHLCVQTDHRDSGQKSTEETK